MPSPVTTKRSRYALPVVLASTLVLAACGNGGSAETGAAGSSGEAEGGTVTIEDNTGSVEIPASPQRVAALDNTSFETLREMGITPVAAPKPLLPPGFDEWQNSTEIQDAGSHREPNFEALNEAQPDLIVGGKRFEDHQQTLEQIAPVVDLAPKVDQGEYVDGLKQQTTTLGEIFDKGDVANQLNADLDAAVERAAAQTNGQTVFLANHNGGKIDNGAGRLAPILQPLNMTDVFAGQDANSESVHQDSGLAPETVAAANPDWMFVLDRDAATAEGGTGATPARSTVEAQTAWADTTFMQNDQIVYLEPEFYVTEGIQAYTDAYEQIADAMENES